jgi:hypothetical protein
LPGTLTLLRTLLGWGKRVRVGARVKAAMSRDPDAYFLNRGWRIGSILKEVSSYSDALKRRRAWVIRPLSIASEIRDCNYLDVKGQDRVQSGPNRVV